MSMPQDYVSPVADFAGKVFTKEELEIESLETTVVGGVQINLESPPQGLINHEYLGLLTHESVEAKLLHAWPKPYSFTEPVRACITPGGDNLAICPAGLSHQWGNTHILQAALIKHVQNIFHVRQGRCKDQAVNPALTRH